MPEAVDRYPADDSDGAGTQHLATPEPTKVPAERLRSATLSPTGPAPITITSYAPSLT
jgi:hypothetical protein